jgi:exonuclease V gamma subunit
MDYQKMCEVAIEILVKQSEEIHLLLELDASLIMLLRKNNIPPPPNDEAGFKAFKAHEISNEVNVLKEKLFVEVDKDPSFKEIFRRGYEKR